MKPVLITEAKILVADPLRAREERVVELHRVEMEIALDILNNSAVG